MRTTVSYVTITRRGQPRGKDDKLPIRDDKSGALMKSRLLRLIRDPDIISIGASPTLGKELLAQIDEYHQILIHAEDVNRTTKGEVDHIRRKIDKLTQIYCTLFGDPPSN